MPVNMEIRTLVGITRRHADVPDISSLDDIMQGLHRLLDRSVSVESMTLEDVDIVQSKTTQRVLHSIENMLQVEHE